MKRNELESKHLAELHSLAAAAGIERYRMLSKAELIDRLSDGGGDGDGAPAQRESRPRERRPERERRPRERRPERERARRDERPKGEERPAREERPRREKPKAEEPEAAAPAAQPESERPRRRRRRRRFGRRRKTVRAHELLLGGGNRQAIVYGESRAACTALLREIASELADNSKGPDPIGLLIDPSPEELADWKRDAPAAEIVAAGQAHHADDAIAQAVRRAGAGEDVVLLVDSLTRFAESFAGADEAAELFDAGQASTGSGSLTIVAALERPA